MQTLSKRLRSARTLVVDLGTRELDRLAGLSEGHTSSIETGARPNVEARTAAALARTLGLTLDWLVAGIGDAPPVEIVRNAIAAARSEYEKARPKPTT